MFKQYIDYEGVKTDLWVSKSGIVIQEFYKQNNRICGGLMTPYMARGYVTVMRYRDKKAFTVHRLVASCWSGLSVDRAVRVYHNDGNKQNNHISNLGLGENTDYLPEDHKGLIQKYVHWVV